MTLGAWIEISDLLSALADRHLLGMRAWIEIRSNPAKPGDTISVG